MSEEDYAAHVLRAALRPPGVAREAAPPSRRPDGATVAALRRDKVAFTVLAAAERLGLPLGDEAAAELARLRDRDRVLNRELITINRRLAATGIEYVLLRGSALGRRYPPGHVRQFNDVDILLRRGADLPVALRALGEVGYYVARPVVCRRQAADLWAAVALNKRVPDLDHPMYLDLLTLGPAVDRVRALPLPESAWLSLESRGRGEHPPVLPLDWQTVVFAVELVEREGSYSLRDQLDLLVLARRGARWPLVWNRLRPVPEARGALISLWRKTRSGLLGDALGSSTGPLWATPPQGSRTPVGRRSDVPGRWRRRVVAALESVVRGSRSVGTPALARRVVTSLPAGPWFRLGLPVFLLPVPPRVRGSGRVAAAAGLPGYEALLYPLVPRGYSAIAFVPSPAPESAGTHSSAGPDDPKVEPPCT
ncbi:nucleotidyltransferase family protein [Streptomyces hainanensis]|uniref:Nucleotidyltransferase family protein n=1 Tax=Streptomyces hainanensis TaxID=402648 RepID=A0A4R4TLY1_9ACTN|nr:nucleotidyltransferase family protein [Streptomyces hainanensis]TDC79021.1 hypothetical protein E1283_03660 [Streptomyces hainanensis]